MLVLQPLAFTNDHQTGAVYDEINRAILFSTRASRQIQPSPTAWKGRVIGHADIHIHELNKALYKPFGLAQWLLVNPAKCQTDRDCQIKIDRLATPCRAALCAPRGFHLEAQSNPHIAALAQAFIISIPKPSGRGSGNRDVTGGDMAVSVRVSFCAAAPVANTPISITKIGPFMTHCRQIRPERLDPPCAPIRARPSWLNGHSHGSRFGKASQGWRCHECHKSAC